MTTRSTLLLIAVLMLAGVWLGVVNPTPSPAAGVPSPLTFEASTQRKTAPIPAIASAGGAGLQAEVRARSTSYVVRNRLVLRP